MGFILDDLTLVSHDKLFCGGFINSVTMCLCVCVLNFYMENCALYEYYQKGV